MNILKGLYEKYFTRRALPYWCVMILDCMIFVVAGMLAIYAVSGGGAVIKHFWETLLTLVCMIPLLMIGMKMRHTYSGVLRYTTTVDFVRVAQAVFISGVLIGVVHIAAKEYFPQLFTLSHVRWMTIGVTLILTLFAQWAIRILMKYLYEAFTESRKKTGVYVYGAHEGGVAIARSLKDYNNRYTLKGFVSTDGLLESKYLMGVKVRRDSVKFIERMKQDGATVLMVSPLQQALFRDRTELHDALLDAGIHIMVLPDAESWDPTQDLSTKQLREVDIEDLLPRDKIEVDMNAIGAMLTGKRILITGAAGSIGFEMVRQVSKYAPAELVLVDQAETPMHDVLLFMNKKRPDISCETIVGSIANQTHMESIFAKYKPEYVFHAAAYKHVPMMENNPAMAIQNNVYGTRVIADLAVKYGTKKFVMISTDKAVNPTNVMGCSKRICEIYCQSLNKAEHNKQTQFITTRFGNVLGSNGSVIPLFREQIKNGGPVTVTHPDIIRFFMLIPEACQLVLEAGTMGKGGEIFVFDMGKPVRIADLAKRMINLSGAKDIEIKFTGLRDGEKLYEEVLNDAEQTKPTHHPKIKIAAVREYDYAEALKNEEKLLELSKNYDDMAIVKKMKEIVPEYKSQHSKYEVLDK
ncbi:MAG: polysaccharide biosynthesis protein [Prevotella sp.]|nr:polysaccharide biosynthesis protein [Prevotella sp.]